MATVEKWAKLFKSRHQYADSVPVQFGDAKDAAFNWNGSVLQLLPVTDDIGAFEIGDGTTDFDFKVFLGTTAAFVLFDVGNISLVVSAGVTLSVDCVTDTTSTVTGSIHTDGGVGIAKALWVGTTSRQVGNVQMDGTLIVGNDAAGRDFTVFGDVTAYKTWWDANADTNGTWYFGADTKGVDVKAYGATTGNYLHWDASADDLLLVGTATQLAVAGDTDSASTVTGSLRTAGGLGVVKAAYIGGLMNVAGVATFVVQDIHSAGLTVASAKPVVQGMITFPKLTVTVLTSGAGYNMSAAQLLSGCISDTSATGAIAATLPSVADTVALIPGYVAGTAFYLDMRNPGNQTITLTVDGGGQWTLVGTMTIATVTHKRFLCVINSATTGTIYSVGASTA